MLLLRKLQGKQPLHPVLWWWWQNAELMVTCHKPWLEYHRTCMVWFMGTQTYPFGLPLQSQIPKLVTFEGHKDFAPHFYGNANIYSSNFLFHDFNIFKYISNIFNILKLMCQKHTYFPRNATTTGSDSKLLLNCKIISVNKNWSVIWRYGGVRFNWNGAIGYRCDWNDVKI